MTPAEARKLFPALERVAYLNAGSQGPLMRPVVEEMTRWLLLGLEEGRAGKPYFDQMLELREQLRERLAVRLHVPTENVALVNSTTDACQTVIAGLDLGPEDEVVTTDSEHFGLLGPLLASGARLRFATVSRCGPEDARECIQREITPGTKLLALSAVTWTTGEVLPVEELKEETGLPILVDGAQSVGAMPVKAAFADWYTVSGQKWLCGPETTGGLYVRDPESLRLARPNYASQKEYSQEGFTPRDGAHRFDSGWIPVPSLAGLIAALDAAPQWRYERASEMAARCHALLTDAGLDVATPPGQATLVAWRADDPEAVVARAYERGVVIRDLPQHRPLVRASCGWWTNDDDLERLLEAVT